MFFGSIQYTYSDANKKAIQLHNRITGVPPSPEIRDQMAEYIEQGVPTEAARLATENPYFYNLRLKQWAKRWGNTSMSQRVPLNDMVATVIGFTRDNIPFNQILYGDILYTGADGIEGIDDYASNSNEHYEDLEDNEIDLAANLIQRNQSALNGISDSAGIITSRTFGEAYYSTGTNRRVTRFLFINFLCHDFESLHDITTPDINIRRDVERDPGSDSRVYKNQCVGCHAGQDGLGGAFAYFNWKSKKLTYTPGSVVAKINRNNLYPEGNMVTDDSWINLWDFQSPLLQEMELGL